MDFAGSITEKVAYHIIEILVDGVAILHKQSELVTHPGNVVLNIWLLFYSTEKDRTRTVDSTGEHAHLIVIKSERERVQNIYKASGLRAVYNSNCFNC